MISRTAGVVAVLLVSATSALTSGAVSSSSDPCLGLSQPAAAPAEVLALIEIGEHGRVKYEMDLLSGRLVVDRMMLPGFSYPVNYGMFPCTNAGDGDPLDVLVLNEEPLLPGTVVRVRPVGVLPMIDDGEVDHKVLAVLIGSRDATGAPIEMLSQIPAAKLDQIRKFFLEYKGADAPLRIDAWQGADAARSALSAALIPKADTVYREY